MNAGELKQLLAVVPDDEPVTILSARWEDECHVTVAARTPTGVRLSGNVNHAAAAPEVQRKGRWPKATFVPKPPVDRDKLANDLLGALR